MTTSQLDFLANLVAAGYLTIGGLFAVRSRLLNDPWHEDPRQARLLLVEVLKRLAELRQMPPSEMVGWPAPSDEIWNLPVGEIPADISAITG